MNYKKIYEDLINSAKKENRIKLKKTNYNYVYYEKHHINPRCLDGTNDEDNLVLLTAKEHFVAHKLLTYIYKGNRKIACAYHKMAYSNNGNHIKSSRDYVYARELISLTPISNETRIKMSINNGWKNPETRIKMQETRITNSHLYKSNDFKLKMSEVTSGENNGMYGKTHTLEARNKIKKARKKQINPMFGKTHSNESKMKMKNSHLNKKKIECPYCLRTFDPGNFSRYHGEKCSLKNQARYPLDYI